MSRVIVLMYHALHRDTAELEAIDPADRPYAVTVADFEAHLDCLQREGVAVLDPLRLARGDGPRSGVVITFDDGHASNHRDAFPRLAARGLPAVFFVTSDFIGRRPGFCTWAQLAEMAAAGMHVGSHGRSHRFFDDLDAAAAAEELASSRDAIAQATGRAPTLLSFPGGRYAPGQAELARRAGFELLFTSETGANEDGEFRPGALVRRMPIRATTPLATFRAWARGEPLALWRAGAASSGKRGLRRVLGNRIYHAVYERLARH